ncbi:P4HA [Mytilus coruscus]|uniref:procollagen-proline 4-dioxygenase n=1 Tax=Mytilus coruscus TaxID=42192 RepID=A0A6J8DVY6_MYTCO|nr:P4HA [Mytilus coruscus]
MKFVWTLSYVCSFLHIIEGEIFSSVYKLSILAKEEGKLLEAFKKFVTIQINDQRSIYFELQRLLDDLEPTVSQSCQDPKYAENPINAFHLIGRFVYKWPVVFANILCEDCELDEAALHLNMTYQTVNGKIDYWPDDHDIKASAQALLRLRTFYYFNIDETINGVLFGEHCQPLNPSQILKLIRIATDSNMLHEARLWCEALLRKLPFSSYKDEHVNEVAILRLLATIYNKAGMHERAADILFPLHQLGHSEIDREYELYKNNVIETGEPHNIALVKDEYDSQYKQLCRENRKTPRELSELYCYLSNTSIPYYKGKLEIVNLQPVIYLFHDVISNNEAAYFRNEATKKFKRSVVLGDDGHGFSTDKERISQTAWLFDELEIVKRATLRVGLLTGLVTTWSPLYSNSEPFQIVNYGIGGMYHPHFDALLSDKRLQGVVEANEIQELKGTGDRIATWLYYLNDVEVGGATVFPNINTRVPVIKGAAAFWYNLLPRGDSDNRTLHAGCPVVIGSKWVGNKWIREAGQMFKRPCDLDL